MSASYDDVMASLGLEPSSSKRGRRRGKTGETAVECGTYSGYTRHKQLGEDADEACLDAKRAYYRDWYQRNRSKVRRQRRTGGSR